MAKQRHKGAGRPKGSRNKGYFFREGRGWFTKDPDEHFIPLTDADGQRLRDGNLPDAIIRQAHARYLCDGPGVADAGGGEIMSP